MSKTIKKEMVKGFGEAFLKSEKKLFEQVKTEADFDRLMSIISEYSEEVVISAAQQLLEDLKTAVIENGQTDNEKKIKALKKELLVLFSAIKDEKFGIESKKTDEDNVTI